MRVQHPEKRQHEIAPAGKDPIVTDEHGIADVDDDIAKSLLDQGWTEIKGGKSATDKEK